MEMLALYNLKTARGSKKKKRRVGRGSASGRGNYSGRGIKGQKARTGGKKRLALKGVKSYLQRVPKVKGFKSQKLKLETVNIISLNKNFNEGDEVTPRILLNKGLIKSVRFGVKILGDGKLTKKLTVKANQFSKTAKDAILKAGGKVEVIEKRSKGENLKANLLKNPKS